MYLKLLCSFDTELTKIFIQIYKDLTQGNVKIQHVGNGHTCTCTPLCQNLEIQTTVYLVILL